MFKNGFIFKVVTDNANDNITGQIDGITTTGIYSVVFRNNGSIYYRADVYEGTIINKLKSYIRII